MPHPAVAIVGGGLASSAIQSRAARKAGRAQERKAERERRASDGCAYDASPSANRGPKV